MATVRELVTQLSFRADNQQAERYEKAIVGVKRAARRAALAIGGLSISSFALAKRIASQTDEINDLATETGTTADEFQRLAFALTQVTGISGEEVERALGRLNQRIGRARREGGKYADALKAIGFSTDEIQSGTINATQALNQLSDSMAKTQSSTEAAAVAGDLLGTRLGRRIGPALRQNIGQIREMQREANRLGGGFSKAAIEAGGQFNEALDKTRLIMKSVQSEIAKNLLPILSEVIGQFATWFENNKDLIMQNVGQFARALGVTLVNLATAIGRINKGIQAAVHFVGGWQNALRILNDILLTIAANKFLRFMGRMVEDFKAARGAGRGLVTALSAMFRLTKLLRFTIVGLVVDDFITWLTRGDSLLGDMLDMLPKIVGWFEKWAKISFSGIVSGVSNLASSAASSVGSFFGYGSRNVAQDLPTQQSLSRNININASTEASLQVPFGTEDEQRRAIEEQAQQIFRDRWDRQIRQALMDFQPIE